MGCDWTLFVELKFYLLVWLLSAARQMPRVEAWLYVWLAATLVCFLPVAVPGLRSLTIYPYSPLFIAGGLCYLVRTSSLTRARLMALLICLSLATIHTVNDMPKFVQSTDINGVTIWERRLIVISVFAVFAFISLRRSTAIPFARLLTLVGALTYPLYLLHNIGKHVILVPLAPAHPVAAL